METNVSESESGEEYELDDILVVRGLGVGNFQGFFFQIMSHVFFFGSINSILSQNNL